MRSALMAAVLALAGCGATTHPRYAPELGRRWVDCQRIVVIPGTVDTQVKNYRIEDYFPDPDLGNTLGDLLAQGAGRVLRDAHREPRIAADAARALGGDRALVRTVADRLLNHAREWMARDAGYNDEQLTGLPSENVVPEELRRSFDAVLVIGGRTKFETPHESVLRYRDIVLRNAVAWPLLIISPIIPPAFPVSVALLQGGLTGYWVSAPNVSYFWVALYDSQTGRLLYVSDWFDTEKMAEPEELHTVALEMLAPLMKVHGPEDGMPLGERPPGWVSP
jgi:hypothetical protein